MDRDQELNSNVQVFIIDKDLRKIILPDNSTILGVAGDICVNQVVFNIPRIVNGYDLSEFTPYIDYTNANGEGNYSSGVNIVNANDTVSFVWELEPDVTTYSGNVLFAVRLLKVNSSEIVKRFKTQPAKAQVVSGLNVTSQVTQEAQYDILARIEMDATNNIKQRLRAITDQHIDELNTCAENKLSDIESYVDNMSSEFNQNIIDKKKEISDLTEISKKEIEKTKINAVNDLSWKTPVDKNTADISSLKEDLDDLASKKMQYISSDTAQSDTLWRNLSNGLTRANGFSGFTTFSAFTVSKGKYYIDKPIWHKYSWVKKTNGTIVALNTIDGESGDNYSGVIEFTEDVELYITIKTANLPLMIVDGETAPSEYHDKGVYGKSVNGDYKVDNYTLSEIEKSAIKDFSSIDYFFVKNGKLVCNNDKRTTSNAVAKYARVDMGTNVKKAMCKFNSRGEGNVTLIASQLDTDNHVQNIVNKSIHCIFGMSSCVAQVFLNGTATSLGTITYPTLTADDETEYECGFEILNDTTLRLYAPDGQTLDCTGNWSEYIGKYFIFEEYNGNPPSTDSVTELWKRPSILSVYCKPTSGHCLRDDFVNYADGYIPLVAPSGHSYINFRNANSNDGKYVNANGTHDN